MAQTTRLAVRDVNGVVQTRAIGMGAGFAQRVISVKSRDVNTELG